MSEKKSDKSKMTKGSSSRIQATSPASVSTTDMYVHELIEVTDKTADINDSLAIDSLTETHRITLQSIIKMIKHNTYQIGDVILGMTATNPAAEFGGTWDLIVADAAIALGDGSTQSGNAVGNNEVTTLIKHTHERGTMEITGSAMAASTPVGLLIDNGTLPFLAGALKTNNTKFPGQLATTTNGHSRILEFKGSDGWSGSTSEAGSDTKINVRGARLFINAWLKTA